MATAQEPPHCDSALRHRLAHVLPQGITFGVHHLSTPPRKTDALCSAPPKERPDRTYCENHFLAVSIDTPSSDATASSPKKVLAFGIEVFIYTTAHSTLLFVSKADSTGFLSQLNLPKGTASPIREVCAALLAHLVESRRRKDIQCVVSLFARAQDQYLFPGSVKYAGKHVLDDRGLIKWWCRVLDPLISSPPHGTARPWTNATGYVVVPGLDDYETRAFVPKTEASSWQLTHPLERISHYTREFDWVPPRCLIPRFPDDPKSRFRDELDEEAHQSGAMRATGSWRSVKTLDMFWEMMAFRQECSSGRMTGFIWVVFDDVEKRAGPETPKKQRSNSIIAPKTTPRKLFSSKADVRREAAERRSDKKRRKAQKQRTKLKGPIKPRQPRIKSAQRNYLLKTPVNSPYYYWPAQGRGQRIVDENDYKRIMELLLHLDFATLDKAVGSTRRWISEVALGGEWGWSVTGQRAAKANGADSTQVNNLSGLVKRKRSATDDGTGVQTLDAGLVKKKRKHADETQPEPVNVLNAGLVRKKPKA